MWGERGLISGGADGALRVWDLTDSRCLLVLEGHTSAVACCSVMPPLALSGEARCGWCDRAMSLEEVDAHRCNLLPSLPAASWLALSGGADETMRLWDLSRGCCLRVTPIFHIQPSPATQQKHQLIIELHSHLNRYHDRFSSSICDHSLLPP